MTPLGRKRSPSHCDPRRLPHGQVTHDKPYIVGADFLAVRDEAKTLLARAMAPAKPGRPRTITPLTEN